MGASEVADDVESIDRAAGAPPHGGQRVIVCAIVLLSLLGALGWRLRRRRTASVAWVAGLLLLLLAGCGPLPAWWLGDLQRGYPARFDAWGARNVVIRP